MRNLITLILLLLAIDVSARTIIQIGDVDFPPSTDVSFYQGENITLDFRARDKNQNVNLTGYTNVIWYILPSNTSTVYVVASSGTVTIPTNGYVSFSLSTTDTLLTNMTYWSYIRATGTNLSQILDTFSVNILREPSSGITVFNSTNYPFFSEVDTLATVTARGSNTYSNVSLRGNWVSLGSNSGIEVWGTLNGINLGHNIGTRTNLSQGSINGGRIGSVYGVQTIASSSARGSINFGSFDSSASPMLQYMTSIGGFNFGALSAYGKQYSLGAGAMNFGRLSEGIQTNEGVGSLNLGLVAGGLTDITPSIQRMMVGANGSMNIGGITAGYQIMGGAGSLNIGAITDAGQYLTGNGSLNLGYLTLNMVQTNSGSGSVIMGGPGTNTHDYAILLGSGLVSLETNAVHARKYYENGVWIGQLYGSNQTLDVVAQRGSNTTANVYLNGNHTTIGENRNSENWSSALYGLNLGYLVASGVRTNSGSGSINAGVVARGTQSIGVNSEGNINFGSLKSAFGGQYIAPNALGSGNFGCLPLSSSAPGYFQYVGANGSYNFGCNNSNTHDFAVCMGFGVDSIETNTVHARKFSATQAYGISSSGSLVTGITYSICFTDKNDLVIGLCIGGGIVTNLFTNNVSIIP